MLHGINVERILMSREIKWEVMRYKIGGIILVSITKEVTSRVFISTGVSS